MSVEHGDPDCYLPSNPSLDPGPIVVAPLSSSSSVSPASTVVVFFVTGQGEGAGCGIWTHHNCSAQYVKGMMKRRGMPDVYVMTKREFVSREHVRPLPPPNIIHFMTVHMRENANDDIDGETVMKALRDFEQQGVVIFPPLRNVRYVEIKRRYMDDLTSASPPRQGHDGAGPSASRSSAFLQYTVILKSDFSLQGSINAEQWQCNGERVSIV